MTTILYRVERPATEEYSDPVRLSEAMEQVRERVQREKDGPLRILRVEYTLNPYETVTESTGAIDKVWRETIFRFPDIRTAGIFVCKPLQHGRPGNGKGNAVDWQAPVGLPDAQLIEYLWDVFDFLRAKARLGELPVSELIFRDKIATKAQDWTIRHHGGTFHATHVHSSGDPLLGAGPCG